MGYLINTSNEMTTVLQNHDYNILYYISIFVYQVKNELIKIDNYISY